MTVTTTANKVTFQGNGASTVWPFAFIIPEQGDLQVSTVDVTSGNEVIIAPVNYSVTGFGDPNGGSITYPLSGSPLSAAFYLVIQRILPLTQETDITNQSAVYPQDIEDALDYLMMVAQQLQDALDRAIIFSAADSVAQTLPTATARANKFLGFDSSGDPIAADGLTAGTTVSAAMIPVVTAPSTAAALTALGIPGNLLDQLIPAGTVWDYCLTSAPAGFLFPSGQACTSSYPVLRAALVAAGSPFGTNGVDPLLPDGRSVVVAGKSNMNGANNGLLTGGTVLGNVLGVQNKSLLTSNLPAYTPTGTIAGTLSASGVSGFTQPGVNVGVGGSNTGGNISGLNGLSISATFTGVPQGGTAASFSIVQPTIVLNKIIKVH